MNSICDCVDSGNADSYSDNVIQMRYRNNDHGNDECAQLVWRVTHQQESSPSTTFYSQLEAEWRRLKSLSDSFSSEGLFRIYEVLNGPLLVTSAPKFSLDYLESGNVPIPDDKQLKLWLFDIFNAISFVAERFGALDFGDLELCSLPSPTRIGVMRDHSIRLNWISFDVSEACYYASGPLTFKTANLQFLAPSIAFCDDLTNNNERIQRTRKKQDLVYVFGRLVAWCHALNNNDPCSAAQRKLHPMRFLSELWQQRVRKPKVWPEWQAFVDASLRTPFAESLSWESAQEFVARARLLDVCIGLASLDLPVLIVLEIFKFDWPHAKSMSFDKQWQVAKSIKQFKK